jgi:hypothetical protein
MGLNPAEGMDVCRVHMCCPVLVEASATGWSLVQRSPTMCLIVCVIKKPQYRGGQGSNMGCSAIAKKFKFHYWSWHSSFKCDVLLWHGRPSYPQGYGVHTQTRSDRHMTVRPGFRYPLPVGHLLREWWFSFRWVAPTPASCVCGIWQRGASNIDQLGHRTQERGGIVSRRRVTMLKPLPP